MEDIIQNAILQFRVADLHFLLDHQIVSVQRVVNKYIELRERSRQVDVSADALFKRRYGHFYSLSRYTSNEYREHYFAVMSRCLIDGRVDLDPLLIELENTDRYPARIEMSFVSKLMSIVDDSHFPIYDKNVREFFHFVIPNNRDAKFEYYHRMYDAIIETYAQLSNDGVINSFREVYACPDLPSFRILDFIVVQIERHRNQH